MGTTFTAKVIAEDLSNDQHREILGAIESQLENVNAKMSTYLDSSELSRFNQSRETGPFPLWADTITVLSEALRISDESQGAFDITVGPLVNAWGFGAAVHRKVPTGDELDRLRSRLGWNRIKVDETAGTIRKLEPSIECDLSAIAKGYAVDRVSEALVKDGLGRHMVEVGGEIRTAGRNSRGEAWRIAIERPLSTKSEHHRALGLEDMAMATSGDYRNFYETRISNLIQTSRPSSGVQRLY